MTADVQGGKTDHAVNQAHDGYAQRAAATCVAVAAAQPLANLRNAAAHMSRSDRRGRKQAEALRNTIHKWGHSKVWAVGVA